MNWSAAGAIGEIIAAAAVIASLIIVGYQLRLGQKVERAAGQRDVLKQGRDWLLATQGDPTLFRSVSSVLMASYENADPDEQQAFFTWMFDFYLIFEQAFYMYRDGFFNQASFEGLEAVAIGIARTPGGAECWVHIQRLWGVDAKNHLSRRLQELGEEALAFDQLFPYYLSKYLSLEAERE